MDLRGIVAAPKTSVKPGDWKQGEIPRSLWPSRKAKSKAYKFGPLYQWRVVCFSALGRECRVRILFNQSKQIFRATLGVTSQGETVVLCDYEFHATEPGWHCHARCADISTVDANTNRFGSVRLPKSGAKHRRPAFNFEKSELSPLSAFNCAVKFYGIDRSGGAL